MKHVTVTVDFKAKRVLDRQVIVVDCPTCKLCAKEILPGQSNLDCSDGRVHWACLTVGNDCNLF